MTSLVEPMLVPVNTFPSSSIKKAFICFPVLSSFFPKKKNVSVFPFALHELYMGSQTGYCYPLQNIPLL